MSTHKNDEWEDFNDGPKEPIPVIDLPWYESLRIVLEPFAPAVDAKEADSYFSTAEIISSIEQHHGVPQGAVGKEIYRWIMPEDFVRAMRYLGYHESNAGGVQLQWLMKKKK